jgi:4-hydroxybenzoate polyprenyltransferase
MSDMRGKLVAYAELSRATNVPTVWSNVVAGAGLGFVAMRVEEGAPPPTFPWVDVGVVALGVSLLYIAGMIQNALLDADVDARERPSRPLPSRRVSRREASMLLGGAVGLGFACVALVPNHGQRAIPLVLALIVCISLYNWLRPRGRRLVLLMGTCRGLVYPLGAAACGLSFGVTWGVGVVVAFYTAVFSMVARDEEAAEVRAKPLAWALPMLGLIAGSVATMGGVATGRDGVVLVVVALGVMAWLGGAAKAGASEPVRAKVCVLGAISGFCVVDAMVLAAIGLTGPACAAMGCFALTVAGHRRMSGT